MTRRLGPTLPFIVLLACRSSATSHPPTVPAGALVIRDVRVFDGERVLPDTSVAVAGGVIVAIGRDLAVPADATVIDGRGKTLLPGLIDAHCHVHDAHDLEQALAFGVTTELDMMADPSAIAGLRHEVGAERVARHADLRSAGFAATAPGGHGTEYGQEVPTLTEPAAAAAFVAARLAEGSDYLKIIEDDGKAYGVAIPTLTAETVAALVRASHARGRLAIAHIGTLADARLAIDAGVDGLAHLFIRPLPDADFGRDAARHHIFVVPTLTVLHSLCAPGHGADVTGDPKLAVGLRPDAIDNLGRSFPVRGTRPDCTAPDRTIAELDAARVPILAGTDAPNVGTTHGASLHEELALLVAAGLTPSEALRAATAAPARAFRLDDRGRIAVGLRADLVLVGGDPTRDIRASRNLERVWKAGVELDRPSYLAGVAAERARLAEVAATRAQALAGGGISDFEDGTTSARFGAGWQVSTDAIAKGRSTATLEVTGGGAEGTHHSLEVTAEVTADVPYAWAGAGFFPGQDAFDPVDLSSKQRLRFACKGDGQTYRILFFTRRGGATPFGQTFVAGKAWSEVAIELGKVAGLTRDDVVLILFAAGPTPGHYDFQLDEVRLE